ncbi:Hypothetical protein, putative, partial [Bodo saltans]
TLALSTLAVACQVWYLFGSVVDGVELSALSQLLTAAAACDIIVAAVSMLKSLFDVVDVLRACRRHVKVMFPMLFWQALSSEPNEEGFGNKLLQRYHGLLLCTLGVQPLRQSNL